MLDNFHEENISYEKFIYSSYNEKFKLNFNPLMLKLFSPFFYIFFKIRFDSFFFVFKDRIFKLISFFLLLQNCAVDVLVQNEAVNSS